MPPLPGQKLWGIVQGASFEDLREQSAEFIFDLPVKLAYPTGVTGFYDRVSSPVYSTGVGLLKWAAEDKQNFGRLPLAQTTTVLRMKKQMKDLFGNLFS